MTTPTADQFDPSLRAAWHRPEELPPPEAWLTEPRGEAAQAQYAYLILKKHRARIGAGIERDELPASWWSFGRWLFYANVEPLLSDGGHSAMLKDLLAEIVRFTQAFSGEYFTDNLYVLLENILEEQKLSSLIRPLLPPEASARFDDLMERLWSDRDDARRRADEGYY